MNIHALFLAQELHRRRVNIAAARPHGNARERRKAHGRIDALPALDRGDGGTVAQMAGDDLQVLGISVQVLRRRLRDELVRSAVRAVLSDLIGLVIVVIDRVQVRIIGHGGMEGRIEDERHLFIGHDGAAGVDAEDRRRVVQRRKFGDLVHRLHHFVGDERGLLERLAGGDDAVSDGVDLVHRADDARFPVDQFA